MEIINLILNSILVSGLAGTVLFYNIKKRQENASADSAEIGNTEKIIGLQSEHITRLDGRVEKLEKKVGKLEIIIEKKDSEIDTFNTVVRQAYRCPTPNDQCPVLIMRERIEKRRRDKEAAQLSSQPENNHNSSPQ